MKTSVLQRSFLTEVPFRLQRQKRKLFQRRGIAWKASNGILEPNEIVIGDLMEFGGSAMMKFVLPGRAEKSRRDVPHERVKLRMR